MTTARTAIIPLGRLTPAEHTQAGAKAANCARLKQAGFPVPDGLVVFAEHTADARNRPGAHPNVDRLLAIAAGGAPLQIEVVAAGN